MCRHRFSSQRLTWHFMLLLMVVASSAMLGQTPSPHKLDLKWFFITKPDKWNAPPADPELPQYETATVNLAVFYPSGKFAGGDFWVGRNKRGELFVLLGEGYAVRKGSWERKGDRITVESRWVYANKMVSTVPREGSSSMQTWELRGTLRGRVAARLEVDSQLYIPLSQLQNLTELSRVLDDANLQAPSSP